MNFSISISSVILSVFFGRDINVNKPQKKQSALACVPLDFSWLTCFYFIEVFAVTVQTRFRVFYQVPFEENVQLTPKQQGWDRG